MKRAVVTGATGFIGKALTKELLDRGVEVWAVVRDGRKLDNIQSEMLHIVEADFGQYLHLAEKITVRSFDVFFHFAWAGYGAATNDCEVQTANVLYAYGAAKAAAELGARRFVFADSSHEYLVSKAADGEWGRCSVYGTAKHCAQQMCRTAAHNAGMEFVGVMFVNIFGVGDMSNRSTNTMLRKLLNNEDLDLVREDRLYDWTYIDDCVEGAIMAAERGSSGKVYYVGGEPRRFGEIMTEVCSALGINVQLRFGVFPDDTEIAFDQMDIAALRHDTGFMCKADFKESIMKTARWLQMQKSVGGGGTPSSICYIVCALPRYAGRAVR